ncbi:MAG: hypothetical protein QXI12_07410 [Candidatus Methanomethyliaceae archaeon]
MFLKQLMCMGPGLIQNICGTGGGTEIFMGVPNGRLKADFNVMMLFNRHDSARLIRMYFPDAKFILILHILIERTYSHYWHDLSTDIRSVVPRQFEDALEKSYLVGCSKYYQQIRSWVEYFDKARLCLLFDFDLDNDAKLPIDGPCVFLGIDKKSYRVSNGKAHESFKYRGLYRSALKLGYKARNLGFGPILDFIGKSGLWNVADKLGQVAFHYPPINSDTKERLKEWLMPDIESLEKLLCKDLSSWRL